MGQYDVLLISSYPLYTFAVMLRMELPEGSSRTARISARFQAIGEDGMHEQAAHAMKALIAFHVEAGSCGFIHDGQLFDLADLGAMPNIGDRIVYPTIAGPSQGGNRPPRIVYEVVGRYFLGRETEAELPRIALFVRTEIVADEH